MAYILEFILFTFAVLSFIMGGSMLFRRRYPTKKKILFIAFSFSITWWSFWFSRMVVQEVPDTAYLCRSIAMPGVFLFFILSTMLILNLSQINWKQNLIITCFSLLGLIILPFNILRNSTIFSKTSFGVAYSLIPDSLTYVYTAYVVILLILLIATLVNKKNKKRQHMLRRYFIFSSLAIFLGPVLDTILPLFGIGAFPVSILIQHVGAVGLSATVLFDIKNQLSFENFSNIILYSFTTPVLLMDENHVLVLANNAALTFFRLEEKQLVNVHLENLFENIDLSLALIKEKSYLESQDIVLHRDCSLSIDKLYDNYHDLLGYVIVINDISERKRFIDELMEARILAERASDAKSSFLASMSHEIRTPINAVLGMDEMILRETDLAAIKEYAANIRSSGRALLSIINDILDFSKIESGKMELIISPFQLSSTVGDLMTSLSLRAKEKNLLFECNVDPDTPRELFGDEIRIKQIITNLLTNAIKYTRQGTVSLSIQYEELGPLRINLKCQVKDTGIGIKDEDIEKLFTSFNRLDGHKNYGIEGTGLGLSIVSNLVNLMNGKISVKSTYGSGSTFTVDLPLEVINWEGVGEIRHFTREAVEDSEASAVTFTAPEAAILSVDDNKINLKVFKGLLKETKMRVDLATSGEQCLNFMQKKKYDIVFLDHMMPGMDGVETLHRMKELENNLSPDVPVIALTANALSGAKDQYYDYGFDDYLSKPVDYSDLEKTILSYLPKEKIHPIEEEAK